MILRLILMANTLAHAAALLWLGRSSGVQFGLCVVGYRKILALPQPAWMGPRGWAYRDAQDPAILGARGVNLANPWSWVLLLAMPVPLLPYWV